MFFRLLGAVKLDMIKNIKRTLSILFIFTQSPQISCHMYYINMFMPAFMIFFNITFPNQVITEIRGRSIEKNQ